MGMAWGSGLLHLLPQGGLLPQQFLLQCQRLSVSFQTLSDCCPFSWKMVQNPHVFCCFFLPSLPSSPLSFPSLEGRLCC
jgi:hypothetical protein